MSLGSNAALNATMSILTPTAPDEKLVFRRFKGSALAAAANSGGEISKGDIETVILRVNPEQVQFTKRKIIQKVQTSAPGRFVVFDWGSELTILNIQGNTGNLLPAQITQGTNPLFSTLETIANQTGHADAQSDIASAQSKFNNAASLGSLFSANKVQEILMKTSTYFELLDMSPKYRTFKALERMFDLADADSDVLTLEFGDMAIYRGFFEEFSFEIVAGTPWNWKYNITFVILSNLSEAIQRDAGEYNASNSNLV